jgi:hypothetical protein
VAVPAKAARRSNHFKLSHRSSHADGTMTFWLRIPGPGAVDVLETASKSNLARAAVLLQPARGRFVFARKRIAAPHHGTLHIRVTPNAGGRRLVRHHTHRVTLRLWIVYTPSGGRPRVIGLYGIHLH